MVHSLIVESLSAIGHPSAANRQAAQKYFSSSFVLSFPFVHKFLPSLLGHIATVNFWQANLDASSQELLANVAWGPEHGIMQRDATCLLQVDELRTEIVNAIKADGSERAVSTCQLEKQSPRQRTSTRSNPIYGGHPTLYISGQAACDVRGKCGKPMGLTWDHSTKLPGQSVKLLDASFCIVPARWSVSFRGTGVQ